ncbi:peptide ABC transporter substrate-binding protein [Phenylobacterium sp.]|jgi:oligopeptide transport system substrate-binding protein|uniref:peptide ABC transporter substrate-binding protein n=1 Tax=Phenylobacterium sp. TaxID=1871053 RepID=UPI00378470D9
MSLPSVIEAAGRHARNLLIATAAFAGVLGLASCDKGPARPPCPEGKVCLQVGNGSEPISLDPHKVQGTWEHHILLDSFIGLTQEAADGSAVPGVAERWETSADGLTWRFYLRESQWSDGAPVTADDFVFSFRRIVSPQTASEYAWMLYPIRNGQAINEGKAAPETLGVRALGPRVLEIALLHPAPYLPELAKHNTMYPLPKHKIEKLGDAWARPENYVSNGPYRIVAWRLGDYVKAVKNERFWDAGKVCVDEVYYYPTTDAISAERRVRRGELDINTEIQSNRIAFLRADPVMAPYVQTHTYLGVSYLAFNANVPALKDRRVRQALTMSVDREFITNKLLRGGQVPAYNFIPPGVANYRPIEPPAWADWPLERRQAEARRLLAAAGYGPNNPLKLEIKHRNSPDPMLVMPAIQADWKQIGVDLRLAQNETQIAYASYRARDFQIADAAWVADFNDPVNFLNLMQSATGAQNYGDYNNPAYDRLLALADQEVDAERRAEYLAQAERLMLDDAAVVPTYFYVNKNLVNPKITGWKANLVDWHPTRYLCVR